MEYCLLIIYLFAVIWFLPKLKCIKNSDLTSKELRILLIFKLIIGILFATYLSTQLGGDYMVFNEEGYQHYQLLLRHPLSFFGDIFNDAKNLGFGGIFETNSFWGYLRFNLVYKFLAILNLLTLGNFYSNTILFCAATFCAHILFFKIYKVVFNSNKYIVLFSTFFLPSTLIYTSCVHKDGLIFIALSLILYNFFKLLNQAKNYYTINKLTKTFTVIFIAIIAIALVRNYVLVALLPAMFTWWLSLKLSIKKWKTFVLCYILFSFLFFASIYTTGFINLPYAIIERKKEFANLAYGSTTIFMNDLKPNFYSFLYNFPQAINHSIIRPYLFEYKRWDIFLTALEIFEYILLAIIFLFFKKNNLKNVGFVLFGVAFFLSMMLIIGYTIPNIGAIVRYRSVFWMFLMCPIICNINWEEIKQLIFNKK